MFVPPGQRLLVTLSPPVTCVLPSLCFAQYTKIIQKKRKSPEPEPTSPPASPLSSGQLERIARNKRAALEKLTSAQTPAGFGEGWRDKLSAEFGKNYFKQVREISPSKPDVILTSFNNLMSAPADEIRCWRAEVSHRLPTCRSGVHLDADVWHQRCKFNRAGTTTEHTRCRQTHETEWIANWKRSASQTWQHFAQSQLVVKSPIPLNYWRNRFLICMPD